MQVYEAGCLGCFGLTGAVGVAAFLIWVLL